jgi:tape measure domain-containing protein
MAKTVQPLQIKLDVEGIEGVNSLKSSLRGLTSAAGPADKELEKIAREIKKFNVQGKISKDVIAAQVGALTKLRDQAKLGGNAFVSLTKDVVDYQAKLKKAEDQVKRTAKTFKSLSQIQAQIPGRKVSTFSAQIQRFKGELKDLSVVGDEYTKILRQIQERTQAFERAQARQAVIASGQSAARGPVDKRTAFEVTKELPRTTAALSLRLSELREDFQNLAVGSRSYINALREINALEKQVADPFGTSQRKQAIRARLGQQEAFGMFAGRDPVQSSIDRRERRRSRRYRGFTGGGLADQPAQASALFSQIAAIGQAGQAADLQMMGRSYQQVAQSIREATAASNGSINSLQGQRAAWSQIRSGLNPATAAYKEVGREIEKVDRRLNKLNNKRRISGAGLARTAGAIAAGGIFGGPEGALGGLAGAPFGAAGAATGAAVGAQLSGLRKAAGASADYAAQIQKLKIALNGVTSNQSEFNFATAAARKATEELNIPQAQSIAGITRLSAAVKGANGPITDAVLTFRNVTAAIKATGGSSEDVQGAITALVQVFSKGKVSAEELSGQLGERLPGAVTAFAKANNLSLPELQKNLKAGTVGLDELMKFVEALGEQYGETAKKIADSNADAGARLNVQVKNLQAAVGEELVPIGAQFQDAFGKFIEEITPTLVVVVPKIAEFFLLLAQNLGKVLEVAVIVLAAVTAAKIDAIVAAIGSAVKAVIGLGKAAVVGKGALIGLNSAALLNPYTALAAGAAFLALQIGKAASAQRRLNALITSGSSAELRAEITKKSSELDEIEQQIKSSPTRTKDDIVLFGDGGLTEKLGAKRQRLESERAQLTQRLGAAVKEEREQEAKDLAILSKGFGGYGSPAADGGGGGGGGGGRSGRSSQGRKDISDLELQLRLARRIAGRTDATFEQRRRALILERQAAVLKSEELKTNEQIDAVQQASENFRKGNLKIEQDITNEQKKQLDEARKLNDARNQLKDQLGLLTPEERVKAAQESFIANNQGATAQDLDLVRQAINPTILEQGAARVRELREELKELVNPINVVASAGSAIGTAFTDSFKSVIEGSATTQEALASFFRNIGNFFLDMAAQIIQKMITLFILNKFVGLLPGAGGAGVNTSFDIPVPGFRLAGDGAYFSNGIAKFARGGIVNKPTMFAYANGGTGRFGLMGEAGPEAIMPLRRGPGGRLGVESSGGGVRVDTINIKVENTGENLNPAAQKQIAGQVRGIVLNTLANERRSGGLL